MLIKFNSIICYENVYFVKKNKLFTSLKVLGSQKQEIASIVR